nr:thioredoxin-dependent thiol peroxidase [Propionibacterium sp.]
MSKLQVGDPAPAFTLPDADGVPVSLADFAGRRVVVYFYPAALTPGCTTQAVDFTAAREQFDAAGLTVLGISPDAPAKLARFRTKHDLAVRLLSDADKDVLRAYGAYGLKKLYGKEIEGVIRSTFVIDVDAAGAGTIALAQYGVKATGHVDRLRRELGL